MDTKPYLQIQREDKSLFYKAVRKYVHKWKFRLIIPSTLCYIFLRYDLWMSDYYRTDMDYFDHEFHSNHSVESKTEKMESKNQNSILRQRDYRIYLVVAHLVWISWWTHRIIFIFFELPDSRRSLHHFSTQCEIRCIISHVVDRRFLLLMQLHHQQNPVRISLV